VEAAQRGRSARCSAIAGPGSELRRVLDGLPEQTGGGRDERYRSLIEDGARAVRAGWCDELSALNAGCRPARGRETS
jgi:hypothetical protein